MEWIERFRRKGTQAEVNRCAESQSHSPSYAKKIDLKEIRIVYQDVTSDVPLKNI